MLVFCFQHVLLFQNVRFFSIRGYDLLKTLPSGSLNCGVTWASTVQLPELQPVAFGCSRRRTDGRAEGGRLLEAAVRPLLLLLLHATW
jgi:hypothetical protein